MCRYTRGEIKAWRCELYLRLQLVKYKLLAFVDKVYFHFAGKKYFMASVTVDEIYTFLEEMDYEREDK